MVQFLSICAPKRIKVIHSSFVHKKIKALAHGAEPQTPMGELPAPYIGGFLNFIQILHRSVCEHILSWLRHRLSPLITSFAPPIRGSSLRTFGSGYETSYRSMVTIRHNESAFATPAKHLCRVLSSCSPRPRLFNAF